MRHYAISFRAQSCLPHFRQKLESAGFTVPQLAQAPIWGDEVGSSAEPIAFLKFLIALPTPAPS